MPDRNVLLEQGLFPLLSQLPVMLFPRNLLEVHQRHISFQPGLYLIMPRGLLL